MNWTKHVPNGTPYSVAPKVRNIDINSCGKGEVIMLANVITINNGEEFIVSDSHMPAVLSFLKKRSEGDDTSKCPQCGAVIFDKPGIPTP